MYGENTVSLSESDAWFVRLWRRYRPATGWGVFLLTLAAVLLLPIAVAGGELIPGVGPAVLLSVVGFVFTWWLAPRRISGPAAAVVILLTGIVADLIWGVFVLRPGALVPQLVSWWRWSLGERAAPEPVVTFFREQGSVLAGYFERVSVWVRGLILGPGAPDNLVVIGLIVLLAWLLAAWAAWWVARRREPFIAVLPTGVFLAQHAFWAPDTVSYVLLFLAATVMLLALARLVFQTREWDATGVDYAEDIRLEALLAGFTLTVIVTLIAPTVPFIASGELSQKFWTLFEDPWRRVESQMSASFQVARPVRSLVPPAGAEPGGLPRAHLLGGRPQLGEEVALRVSVRGDPSNLQLYWRGQTYAQYTGRGWEAGADAGTVEEFSAGQPWGAGLPSTEARRPILVTVQAVEATRAVIYATGEPVSVDRPYRAIVRGADDLVALSASGGAGEYQVLSHAPEQDAARLRAAGANYPPEVIARHLQLPDSLDPRIVELARALTEGAATPYDAAVAIEAELRKIPYSLDLPTPPDGRGLVSWFLFDLKKGYCDYYASAMVVLARLSGIPARLAIGYATGELDPRTGQWFVTEQSAHSWPELYFPGIGWVPFEPTAYQPQPPRIESGTVAPVPPLMARGPEDLETGLLEIQASAQQNAVVERRASAVRGLLAAVFAMADRFTRWGRRLGRPLAAGETAREYALGVAKIAEQIGARTNDAAVGRVVRVEGTALAAEVERSLYAPEGAGAAPGNERGLWTALRRLWLAGKRVQLPRRASR